MCGCEKHWRVGVPCTCLCAEHLEHRMRVEKVAPFAWMSGALVLNMDIGAPDSGHRPDTSWLGAWGATEAHARRRLARQVERLMDEARGLRRAA